MGLIHNSGAFGNRRVKVVRSAEGRWSERVVVSIALSADGVVVDEDVESNSNHDIRTSRDNEHFLIFNK